MAPFTVLSCDNIPGNGPATSAAVVGFAELRDPGLARWIEDHVAFPSSMVDRITPGSDDAARRLVAERYGVSDRSPVVTEPFAQWVVEDRFCNGRPPLEQVGVRFVADVEPYKVVKTRLLNASHSALGYLGYLAGYRTSDEAMANPVIADYLAAMMADEVAPLLPTLPDVDLAAYQRTLLERFANPRIADGLDRLCGRGSTKMPSYLLPSLVEGRDRQRPAPLLALAVAAWFCYLGGEDLDGRPIEVRDARREQLQGLVAGGDDPRPLLGERSIFGALGDDTDLAISVEEAIDDMRRLGPVAAACDRLALDLPEAA